MDLVCMVRLTVSHFLQTMAVVVSGYFYRKVVIGDMDAVVMPVAAGGFVSRGMSALLRTPSRAPPNYRTQCCGDTAASHQIDLMSRTTTYPYAIPL